MTRNILYILIFSILAFTNCKDSEAVDSGNTFPENMQGVWQEQPFDDGDEIGLYFTDRIVGFWDYMGDAYDEGEDCYFADTAAVLISFEGTEFRVRETFEGTEDVANITVDGSRMTITYTDEDGTFTDVYTKDSRTVSQLTPKCEISFGFKNQANPVKTDKLNRMLQGLKR